MVLLQSDQLAVSITSKLTCSDEEDGGRGGGKSRVGGFPLGGVGLLEDGAELEHGDLALFEGHSNEVLAAAMGRVETAARGWSGHGHLGKLETPSCDPSERTIS